MIKISIYQAIYHREQYSNRSKPLVLTSTRSFQWLYDRCTNLESLVADRYNKISLIPFHQSLNDVEINFDERREVAKTVLALVSLPQLRHLRFLGLPRISRNAPGTLPLSMDVNLPYLRSLNLSLDTERQLFHAGLDVYTWVHLWTLPILESLTVIPSYGDSTFRIPSHWLPNLRSLTIDAANRLPTTHSLPFLRSLRLIVQDPGSRSRLLPSFPAAPCLEEITVQNMGRVTELISLGLETLSALFVDIFEIFVASGSSPLLKSITWQHDPFDLKEVAHLQPLLEDLRRMDGKLDIAGVHFYFGNTPATIALAQTYLEGHKELMRKKKK